MWSKAFPWTVEALWYLTFFLQTIVCYFAGPQDLIAKPFSKFYPLMRLLQGNKWTETRQSCFSISLPPIRFQWNWSIFWGSQLYRSMKIPGAPFFCWVITEGKFHPDQGKNLVLPQRLEAETPLLGRQRSVNKSCGSSHTSFLHELFQTPG